jgi:hypothetical protein
MMGPGPELSKFEEVLILLAIWAAITFFLLIPVAIIWFFWTYVRFA